MQEPVEKPFPENRRVALGHQERGTGGAKNATCNESLRRAYNSSVSSLPLCFKGFCFYRSRFTGLISDC
jgi:hypothetical protein